MKKLIEETNDSGLEALISEYVEVLCFRYIYHGKLVGVSDTDILLTDASVVFETGSYDKKEYEDIQPLGRDVYLRKSAIESYMKAK